MIELAEEDPEGLTEAAEALESATRLADRMEFERMLSGPHDRAACFISVNAGAGGTESQDWAEILLRMLLRFCERRGYQVDVTDRLDGEEAGVKSATL